VLALLPRPVIEADDTKDLGGEGRRHRARQQAQNGAIADRHPQPRQQPLTAPSAQRMADQMPDRPEAVRVLDTGRGDPRSTDPQRSPSRSAGVRSASG
jgi:hypothetical protein